MKYTLRIKLAKHDPLKRNIIIEGRNTWSNALPLVLKIRDFWYSATRLGKKVVPKVAMLPPYFWRKMKIVRFLLELKFVSTMKHVPSYNLHAKIRLSIKERTLDSSNIISSIEGRVPCGELVNVLMG